MTPTSDASRSDQRVRSARRSHKSAGEDPRPAWLAFVQDHGPLAVILAMIVLIPLVAGTARLESAGKMVVFEALGAALIALLIGRIALRLPTGGLKKALAGPNLPLILLLGLGAVSAVVTPFHTFALAELLRWGLCAVVYLVLASQLRRRGLLQTMTDGLLLVTAAVSLIGLAEMADGTNAAVAGPFGSHELLGSFLLLMLPVALALGLAEGGDERRQLAAQGVALLAGACLLMARTRSAWIGAVVSLVVLALLAWRQMPVDTRDLGALRRRKHLIIGPLLILCVGLALLVGVTQTGSLLDTRAATLAHADVDGSFQARLAMWRGALHMAEARPLFGWGIGSFPIRESAFTGTGNSPSYVLAHGTSHSNIAHNLYLQTAAEMGFVGLALYLAVLVAFFTLGLRALGQMRNKSQAALPRLVLIGCLAAMAGQVVDAAGSPAYNFASVSLFQWVLLGIGTAAMRLGVQSKTAEIAAEAAPSVRMPRPLRAALSGACALAIVAFIGPSLLAAFAENCTVGNNTFRVLGANGADSMNQVLTPGRTLVLVATLDGVSLNPALGYPTFTLVDPNDYLTLGSAGAPQVTVVTGVSRVTVTRTNVSTNGANVPVTIKVTYTDPKTSPPSQFENDFIIRAD